MAHDLAVNIGGWAATTPTRSTNGRAFTRLRMGTTPRYYDSTNKAWTDGRTEWFSVKIFREGLAENVAESVRKGDPIMVSGRLSTREWQKDTGEQMTSLEIIADSVGHNLAYGSSRFSRTIRRSDGSNSSEEEWETVAAAEDDLDISDELEEIDSEVEQSALVAA